MAWAKQDSVTTTGESIDNTIATTFVMGMSHVFATGGNKAPNVRFDATGGTAYACRYSANGGTDVTEVSQPDIKGIGPTADDDFSIFYAVNISTEEKLVIMFAVNRNSAGAGSFPYREETVGKYSQTSTQAAQIGLIDTGTGSYTTSSNLSSIGTD
jgi:hypothetical protein